MDDQTIQGLERWRHLIEPVITQGLTRTPWQDLLKKQVSLYEGRESVLVVQDCVIGGQAVKAIYVAAGRLDEVSALIDCLQCDALGQGVRRIVYVGRRGWVRALPGFRENAVVGLKEF